MNKFATLRPRLVHATKAARLPFDPKPALLLPSRDILSGGQVQMKNRVAVIAVVVMCFGIMQSAWAQWSSDAGTNLALADKLNNDQVQPKLKPLPNNQWYVSWFDSDPNSPPPVGYDVYYQLLSAGGVEQFPHDGIMIADLSNSSTEDYGLDIDTSGNALLAFLDTREGANQQVTAVRMGQDGTALWGPGGVHLTRDSAGHYSPKIAGTSDGGAVVAWSEDSGSGTDVLLQKLDSNGNFVWAGPVSFHEANYTLYLSDLKASDNGSVIVSWVRESGFYGDKQLRANKVSAQGKKMWGINNVSIFDTGSLQFGNFPSFISDGKGGAVFAWYTSSPTLQCYAQHILANGSEAFPHNGSAVSTDTFDVRVSPSVSYRQSTGETFVFWTEEDSNQFYNGVSGQKFDRAGNSQWGATGMVVVPLGPMNLTETFVENVQMGTGALVMWVNSPAYGFDTIRAAKIGGGGSIVCSSFAVSSARANKYGLAADKAPSGMAALAWADDRIGNNSIYIQNINSDCTLGSEQ